MLIHNPSAKVWAPLIVDCRVARTQCWGLLKQTNTASWCRLAPVISPEFWIASCACLWVTSDSAQLGPGYFTRSPVFSLSHGHGLDTVQLSSRRSRDPARDMRGLVASPSPCGPSEITGEASHIRKTSVTLQYSLINDGWWKWWINQILAHYRLPCIDGRYIAL